jgi:membrane dipeptidase
VVRVGYAAAHPRRQATLVQVADHIDHVRNVAGVEHVGIRADYDGTTVCLTGWRAFPYPADRGTAGPGWSQDECARLAGGNVLRVLHEAEAASRSLSA